MAKIQRRNRRLRFAPLPSLPNVQQVLPSSFFNPLQLNNSLAFIFADAKQGQKGGDEKERNVKAFKKVCNLPLVFHVAQEPTSTNEKQLCDYGTLDHSLGSPTRVAQDSTPFFEDSQPVENMTSAEQNIDDEDMKNRAEDNFPKWKGKGVGKKSRVAFSTSEAAASSTDSSAATSTKRPMSAKAAELINRWSQRTYKPKTGKEKYLTPPESRTKYIYNDEHEKRINEAVTKAVVAARAAGKSGLGLLPVSMTARNAEKELINKEIDEAKAAKAVEKAKKLEEEVYGNKRKKGQSLSRKSKKIRQMDGTFDETSCSDENSDNSLPTTEPLSQESEDLLDGLNLHLSDSDISGTSSRAQEIDFMNVEEQIRQFVPIKDGWPTMAEAEEPLLDPDEYVEPVAAPDRSNPDFQVLHDSDAWSGALSITSHEGDEVKYNLVMFVVCYKSFILV